MARTEIRPSVDGAEGPPPRSPWRAFLLGAVVVVVAVAVVLLVVRTVAFPIFERNSDATKVEATAQAQLAALRTQQALTLVATPLPASAPAPTTIATPAPVVTPVAAPATAQTARQATVAPIPQAAAQTAGPTIQATATVIRVAAFPTRGPIPSPALDAEITEAYQRYFQVKAEALYALDPTGLDEVAADGELMALRKNIDDGRAQGRAIDIDVQHSFLVWDVDGDKAQIADRYQDSSIYVDATTHEPLPGEVRPASPDVAPVVTVMYDLRRIDGVWKVIGGIEYR